MISFYTTLALQACNRRPPWERAEDDVEAATTEIRAVSGTVASRRAEAANAGAAPAGGRPRQAVDSSP